MGEMNKTTRCGTPAGGSLESQMMRIGMDERGYLWLAAQAGQFGAEAFDFGFGSFSAGSGLGMREQYLSTGRIEEA